MKTASRLVLGSGFLFALAPLACGDSEGSGGAPAGTTVAETSAATTKTSGVVAASQTSAMMVCNGSYWGPTCGACLEATCCAELEESGGVWSEGLNECANGGCAEDCFGAYEGAECSVDPALPERGACVAGGGVHDCNPVTQAPCNVANGEACDMNYNSGKFECFGPPNEVTICGACPVAEGNTNVWCAPGLTCVLSECTKFCCEDTDCAPGTCAKNIFFGDLGVGICQTDGNEGGGGGGTGGSGGSGGAGGAGGGPAAGGGGAGGN